MAECLDTCIGVCYILVIDPPALLTCLLGCELLCEEDDPPLPKLELRNSAPRRAKAM
jgi:hypothetical protein